MVPKSPAPNITELPGRWIPTTCEGSIGESEIIPYFEDLIFMNWNSKLINASSFNGNVIVCGEKSNTTLRVCMVLGPEYLFNKNQRRSQIGIWISLYTIFLSVFFWLLYYFISYLHPHYWIKGVIHFSTKHFLTVWSGKGGLNLAFLLKEEEGGFLPNVSVAYQCRHIWKCVVWRFYIINKFFNIKTNEPHAKSIIVFCCDYPTLLLHFRQ